MSETYTLAPQEFDAASRLGADARFAHFLKRVADWETVLGCATRWDGHASDAAEHLQTQAPSQGL